MTSRIALALLAQTEGLTAAALAAKLELTDDEAIHAWINRLLQWGLVERTGKSKGTRYFVRPDLLRGAGLDGRTTLARVQPHRLRALVVEDVDRYPGSAISQIHRRIGAEIPLAAVKRALDELVGVGRIRPEGKNRWRRYHPPADFER